jgi:hypothetical protein
MWKGAPLLLSALLYQSTIKMSTKTLTNNAIFKVSCRLYIDGKYMTFDEDAKDTYYPSSHDQDALENAIHDVIGPSYYEKGFEMLGEMWIDFFDDKDITITHNREETPFPQAWLDKYMNKSFRIHPPQWGQDPWGAVFIEIVPFDSPVPTKMPNKLLTDNLKTCREELRLLEFRMKELKQNIQRMEKELEDTNKNTTTKPTEKN